MCTYFWDTVVELSNLCTLDGEARVRWTGRKSGLVPDPSGLGCPDWIAPGSMTAAQFTYLTNLDMDAVEQPQVGAISDYAELWLQSKSPNQPIRMNGDTLQRDLGYSSFRDAAAAWNAIK